MSLSVLTLNVGGINENPFEFYDVYHKNGQNLTNLERFSKSMKDEVKEFAKLNHLNNTGFITFLRKTFPIGTKNRNQMKAHSPILTDVWFGAKELDRIFGTSGFGPTGGKLNDLRFNIIYHPGQVFEFIQSNSNKSTHNAFRDAWLGFLQSGYTENTPNGNVVHPGVPGVTSIDELVGYLNSKDKGGKNAKFLIKENVEGLILFDYLLMKAFIRSGLTEQEFFDIGQRGQFLDNAAKVVFINQILESEQYDVVFLQEVDAGMMFSHRNTVNSINDSKIYRQYGSQGSVILVHKKQPPFEILESTNINRNIRRNNAGNITVPSELITIYSEEANCCLVSAHLESKEEKAIPQFQRLIKKLNKFIHSCIFIMGIDTNITVPLSPFIGLSSKIKTSPGELITSRKTRTWLQTQMDKADKEAVKSIDYIITNQMIDSSKIISKSPMAQNNGRNSSGILTPNKDWPFDHFGVASVINMVSYSQPNNLELYGTVNGTVNGAVNGALVNSAEGGKKKRKVTKKVSKKKKTTSRK